MPELIRIAAADELAPGSHKLYQAGGFEVALFNLEGTLFAVEDRCPHNAASLSLGTLEGSVVTCPWHAWKFDVKTGEGVGRPGTRLRQFPLSVQEGSILLELPEAEPAPNWDGIHRYLVRYGALGWVGCFGSVEKMECAYRDRVLVHTNRGLEIGEILGATDEAANKKLLEERPAGEVLRLITPQDEREARSQAEISARVFQKCTERLLEQSLPVEVIDCEPLFDGTKHILYYLGDNSPELEHLTQQLAKDCATDLLFHPAIEPPPGEGGCGAGGCGCSH